MSNFLKSNRKRIAPLYIGIVAAVTAVGAVWLFVKGPTPVVRGSFALEANAPFSYMVSAFPFLGILVAEAVELLMQRKKTRTALLLSAVASMMLISHLRISLKIPVSGHALLLSYLAARRVLQYGATSALKKMELVAAVFSLSIIAYIKLVYWGDPVTLLTCISVGILIFAAEFFVLNRCNPGRTPKQNPADFKEEKE